MYKLGIVFAVFWAVGTNLLDRRWYLVHGVSVGDVLFVMWLVFALSSSAWINRALGRALRANGRILTGIVFFVGWLTLATTANVATFGAEWFDFLAIARLLYFCAIIVFCTAFVRKYGPLPLLISFLTGIVFLAAGRIGDAWSGAGPVVSGFPVLRDPNVIGNMLGVGVVFSSLLVFFGRARLAVVFVVLFSAASVMTFSKGTWLMVALGIGANVTALIIRHKPRTRGFARMLGAVSLFLILVGSLVYYNVDTLTELLRFKLQTTEDDASVGLRYRYAIAGLYAMLDHPFVGLGFRNYQVVERLYPQLALPYSDNAHNVFTHVGAIGGIPALAGLLYIYAVPLVTLRRWLRQRSPRFITVWIYLALASAVFALSGAVQLQVIAQPFFWVFAGMVRGMELVQREATPRSPGFPAAQQGSDSPFSRPSGSGAAVQGHAYGRLDTL